MANFENLSEQIIRLVDQPVKIICPKSGSKFCFYENDNIYKDSSKIYSDSDDNFDEDYNLDYKTNIPLINIICQALKSNVIKEENESKKNTGQIFLKTAISAINFFMPNTKQIQGTKSPSQKIQNTILLLNEFSSLSFLLLAKEEDEDYSIKVYKTDKRSIKFTFNQDYHTFSTSNTDNDKLINDIYFKTIMYLKKANKYIEIKKNLSIKINNDEALFETIFIYLITRLVHLNWFNMNSADNDTEQCCQCKTYCTKCMLSICICEYEKELHFGIENNFYVKLINRIYTFEHARSESVYNMIFKVINLLFKYKVSVFSLEKEKNIVVNSEYNALTFQINPCLVGGYYHKNETISDEENELQLYINKPFQYLINKMNKKLKSFFTDRKQNFKFEFYLKIKSNNGIIYHKQLKNTEYEFVAKLCKYVIPSEVLIVFLNIVFQSCEINKIFKKNSMTQFDYYRCMCFLLFLLHNPNVLKQKI